MNKDLLTNIRRIFNEQSIAPAIMEKLLTDIEQAISSTDAKAAGAFIGCDDPSVETSGVAGTAVKATGGFSLIGKAGNGVVVTGGNSTGGEGGTAVEATGGHSTGGTGGIGVKVVGGDSSGGAAGAGVEGIGGSSTSGSAGAGGYFKGGDSTSGTAGSGIVAAAAFSTLQGKSLAGEFRGDVWINGRLTVGGSGSQIDHPLDPEHRVLNHSFVESPEMLNVYNGTIILGDEGKALVQLPEWFEALNKEFCYQLTPIGVSTSLFIEEEIHNNQFQIGGGSPGLKVSWQVTGIRKDKYAETYPIAVEKEKTPEQVGKYLHPQVFGKSIEDSIFAQ
jgi:hypothetical protein